ncbi:hypothetical protein MMC34_002786 [Xylographa carneopallida]|nr:hypothetical protein [Xylographa carneopallida]
MSTARLFTAPQPAQELQGGVTLPPTPGKSAFSPFPPRHTYALTPPCPPPEKIAAKFDLSIALSLAAWPALSLAVQNSWGGPNSAEKREWFAGAVSELLAATPGADVEYVEEFLLQVMGDEFDVRVEDGSAEEVAARIVGLRKLTARGEFGIVDEMGKRWEERQQRGGREVGARFVDGGEEEEEEEEEESEKSEFETGDWEDGVDVEMGEAPDLVKVPVRKPPPEVDEEGFTKVVGKKKR